MKKSLSCLLLATAACLSFPAMAETNYHDAVLDSHGNVVRSALSGTCVRTMWVADGDACGTETVQAAAQTTVETRRARTLAAEERTVYFDFNKSNLRADGSHTLDNLAQVLKSDDQVKSAKIVGFADRIGSVKYNDKLSQKRAKAVSDYLVAQGYVKSSVAETRWVGKREPTANCPAKLSRSKTISCLAPDRKVEVEIEYLPQPYAQAVR